MNRNSLLRIIISFIICVILLCVLPIAASAQNGIHLLTIQQGSFIMGSAYGELDERPFRQIDLGIYYIFRDEVTNAQYASCVASGFCIAPTYTDSATRPFYYGNPDFDNYPMINVDWNMADTFCSWIGGSLPTEAQWEKAARGFYGIPYPWGEFQPTNKGNFAGTDTMPVGSYTEWSSPFQVRDLIGNVAEWTNDWYEASAYQTNEGIDPFGPKSGTMKVVRGASWKEDEQKNLRAANRDYADPTLSYLYIGFRCVSSHSTVKIPVDRSAVTGGRASSGEVSQTLKSDAAVGRSAAPVIDEKSVSVPDHSTPGADIGRLTANAALSLRPSDSVAGDPDLLYQLGTDYEYGNNGKELDYEKAVESYLSAAEMGHAEAQFALAFLYYIGATASGTQDDAVRWMKQSADQGYSSALYYMGEFYLNGEGVPRDASEAERFFRQSADQNFYLAQFALGNMYETGNGVSADLSQAAIWYQKAADQGYADAQVRLNAIGSVK